MSCLWFGPLFPSNFGIHDFSIEAFLRLPYMPEWHCILKYMKGPEDRCAGFVSLGQWLTGRLRQTTAKSFKVHFPVINYLPDQFWCVKPKAKPRPSGTWCLVNVFFFWCVLHWVKGEKESIWRLMALELPYQRQKIFPWCLGTVTTTRRLVDVGLQCLATSQWQRHTYTFILRRLSSAHRRNCLLYEGH